MKQCIIDGCEKYAKGRYCMMHYTRLRKSGKFELAPGFGTKRKHPLYILWHERKVRLLLSEVWLDFWRFVEDVSPKPDGNYFLVRLDGSKPYGPDNWKWQEHLSRKEGEPRKEWWARKWQARQAANPGLERKRSLKRRFGLSVEEYDDMVAAHGGVCAICKRPETAIDGKSGAVKNLAIDHCHKGGQIRGLLCWACNSVLGKVEDSIPRLESMIAYLRKHQ